MLTLAETKQNAQSYIDQASVILSDENLSIVYNSDWLGKMDFSEVISSAGNMDAGMSGN